MAKTLTVRCGSCGEENEIMAPAEGAWEDVDHERVGMTNTDGSTGVEIVPTRQRVVWLCAACGTTNEIARDIEEAP